MEQLKEQYREIFGRYPNGKMSEDKIKAKIDSFSVKPTDDELEAAANKVTELNEKIRQEKVVAEKKPEVSHAEVVDRNVQPVAQGIGPKRKHEVYFRGKRMEWTANTIEAMSKDANFRKEIVFPSDSEYQHSADYNKCKTC